jgi:hypothetical protein
MRQHLEYERVSQRKSHKSWLRVFAILIFGIGLVGAVIVVVSWLSAEPPNRRYNTPSSGTYSQIVRSFGEELKRATQDQDEARIEEKFEALRADLLRDAPQFPTHFVAKHVALIIPARAQSEANPYPFLLGLSFKDEYAKEVIVIYAPGRGAVGYSVGAVQELHGNAVVEQIRDRSK